ncbi:MAG TPA: hypothetical protein PLL30_17345 [Candidatus Krumholzibacteria bacterium]|nr:hypothetical protein [Candidatus Krumholzibacteria bacterium]HPD73542.1 hypothetical protein [Candidatus Krumholzibacteria bacterium]HRY42264.1 hypothetical protein [Candidatus Krumholzibacteria bacterium]
MITPPDVHDCGCRGTVHGACAQSIANYDADRVLAQIEAEEAIQTCAGFNERFGTKLSEKDWLTIDGFMDEEKLVRAAMWRAGWY